MTKITNRARQAIASKNKIYKCGVSLIRKYGFDAVTVEQIAKKAGVSVGTYYYYFNSKMDLLKEIFNKADQYFLNEVEGNFKASRCKEKIIEFFDRYADYTLSDGIEMITKLYTSENKLFTLEGRGMQAVMLKILKEGQDNNEMSTGVSPEKLTRMLFIAARGVIFDWCLYEGQTDLKAEMKFVMETMVRGIA
jgi:AcrR family transcriptional regulator